MDYEDVSDEVFRLQMRNHLRRTIGQQHLIEMFEAAEKRLDDAVKRHDNQFRHLAKNLRNALTSREVRAVVLTRQYSGMMARLESVYQASAEIRSAYADIWQALEWALEEAPFKAISERSRLGYLGKISKNEKARGKAEAMGVIRQEWERWQRREVSYRSDADFGRKMHRRHPELDSDRSIAQRAAKWRKEMANTSC